MCYCSTTLQNTKETFYKGREREINLNSLSNILRAHPQGIAYRSGGRFCRPERSERVLPGRCKGRCKGDRQCGGQTAGEAGRADGRPGRACTSARAVGSGTRGRAGVCVPRPCDQIWSVSEKGWPGRGFWLEQTGRRNRHVLRARAQKEEGGRMGVRGRRKAGSQHTNSACRH